MKPRLAFLPVFILSCSCLASCAFPNGNIEDFEGVYKVESGYESEMHYYWGKVTEKSTKGLPGVSTVLHINHDKSVTYKDGGEVKKGSIKCYSDYCTFENTFFDSSYQFKISSVYGAKSLEYYYKSQNAGVDYDYTVRSYSIRTYYDPEDYKNYVGTYYLITSMYTVSEVKSGQSRVISNDKNYKSLGAKNLTINADKTFTIEGNKTLLYKGQVNHVSDHICLIFEDEKIFPDEMKFYINSNKDVMLLNGSCIINVPPDQTDYTSYYYSLGGSRKIIN